MAQQLTVQGRVVWGHPGELRHKKDRNNQTVMKDGKPVEQCAFGLAIPKAMFDQQPLPSGYTIRQHLEAEARTAFPHGTPQNFAWKFKDGDSVDHKGKPFASREGFGGHYVLTISTQGFAPPIYKSNGQGGWNQMDAKEVKCGDFVAVDLMVKFNGATGTHTPGLYINPNGVLFLGYGNEINNSQDPDEMFGGFQAAQFAGMSAQPQMPQGGAMPSGMQPQPYAASPQPHNPQHYAPAPQVAQQPLPAPAHDFVQSAVGQLPQQPAPVAYNPAPQSQPYGAPAAPYGMPGMPTGR